MTALITYKVMHSKVFQIYFHCNAELYLSLPVHRCPLSLILRDGETVSIFLQILSGQGSFSSNRSFSERYFSWITVQRRSTSQGEYSRRGSSPNRGFCVRFLWPEVRSNKSRVVSSVSPLLPMFSSFILSLNFWQTSNWIEQFAGFH